jgi:hypothetical protein
LFSVPPSHSPTGTLVPSAQMANVTTQQCSAKLTPSIIKATTSRSVRSRAMSSSSAFFVLATNRRDTDDFDVERAWCSTSAPTGSLAARWRRVASPANIRSMTTVDNTSSSAKVA